MSRFRLTPLRVKLSENDVEKACLDLLRLRGYYVVRLQSGLFRTKDDRYVRIGEPGLPDYAVLKRDFFLEVKKPKGKVTPEQVQKHFELQAGYGVAVATVDSVEKLAQWLDAFEKIKGP